ncbi:hypothetical protein E4T42_06872 [Aureobasidium subglaciale]|nr:hypothetical protein E4T42_06872 [Aureobasidium subglaciale]
MAGIPPNGPPNPYPRAQLSETNKAGITDRCWNNLLNKFFLKHPHFSPGEWDPQGSPTNGKLDVIWKETLNVCHAIINPHPSNVHATEYRKYLQNMVAKAGQINNAVCLGLGELASSGRTESRGVFVQQCGMLFALCEIIENQQHMQLGSLPKVFQDPRFGINERHVLETLGSQKIVWPPAADQHIGHHTFVYAPRLPASTMFGTIFKPGMSPEILFTVPLDSDTSGIGIVIGKHYIESVYRTGDPALDPETTAMYDELTRFFNTHESVRFNGIYLDEEVLEEDIRLKVAIEDAFEIATFYLLATIDKGHTPDNDWRRNERDFKF